MRLLPAVIVLHALFAQQALGKRNATVVDIFYESRCPDSLDFLNTTLREAFEDKKLWDSMDIHLHPFGNAVLLESDKVSKGYHFWHPDAQYPVIMCQHGETECFGNRMHACVIALHPNPRTHAEFIICMAAYGLSAGVELASYQCGLSHAIDMEAVQECTESSKQHAMMTAIGATTKQAEVVHVPWVVVNGEHTKDDTFFKPVCDEIHGDKPPSCIELMKTGKVHEEKEHCGGSGLFLAQRSKKPCRRGAAKKTGVTIHHRGTRRGPAISM